MRLSSSKRADSQDNFLLEIGKLVLGTALVLIILGVIGKIAYSVFIGDKQKDPTTTSYEVLLETIKDMKDGETRQVPVFTQKSSMGNLMIIGFAEGQDSVQGSCQVEGLGNQINLKSKDENSEVKKDTRICGDDGCLCLYNVVIVDADFSVNGPPIRCDPTRRSIRPGTFQIRYGDASIKNLFQHLQDLFTDHSEKMTAVTCDFAAVPPFGGVGVTELSRRGDTVYMCWGSDCQP